MNGATNFWVYTIRMSSVFKREYDVVKGSYSVDFILFFNQTIVSSGKTERI